MLTCKDFIDLIKNNRNEFTVWFRKLLICRWCSKMNNGIWKEHFCYLKIWYWVWTAFEITEFCLRLWQLRVIRNLPLWSGCLLVWMRSFINWCGIYCCACFRTSNLMDTFSGKSNKFLTCFKKKLSFS